MECSVNMTRHLQGINKVLIPNFLFFPFPSLPDPVVSLRGCLAFPSPCPGFVPAPLPSSSSTWGEAHLQVSAPKSLLTSSLSSLPTCLSSHKLPSPVHLLPVFFQNCSPAQSPLPRQATLPSAGWPAPAPGTHSPRSLPTSQDLVGACLSSWAQ